MTHFHSGQNSHFDARKLKDPNFNCFGGSNQYNGILNENFEVDQGEFFSQQWLGCQSPIIPKWIKMKSILDGDPNPTRKGNFVKITTTTLISLEWNKVEDKSHKEKFKSGMEWITINEDFKRWFIKAPIGRSLGLGSTKYKWFYGFYVIWYFWIEKGKFLYMAYIIWVIVRGFIPYLINLNPRFIRYIFGLKWF